MSFLTSNLLSKTTVSKRFHIKGIPKSWVKNTDETSVRNILFFWIKLLFKFFYLSGDYSNICLDTYSSTTFQFLIPNITLKCALGKFIFLFVI